MRLVTIIYNSWFSVVVSHWMMTEVGGMVHLYIGMSMSILPRRLTRLAFNSRLFKVWDGGAVSKM